MARIVYRLGNTVELAVADDGRAVLHAQAPPGTWTATLDPVVWPRLESALAGSGFPFVAVREARPGFVPVSLEREPGGRVVTDERSARGGRLAPVLELLDELAAAVRGGAGSLPPAVAYGHVARTGSGRGEPGAAAFGEFRGRPACVVGGEDGTLRVYAVPGGEPLTVPIPAGTAVRAVALRRGLAACAGDDGVVRLWNLGSGRLEAARTGHAGPVRALACHDGAVFSAGGGVHAWDTASGHAYGPLDRDGGAVCVVEAAGGRAVAVAGAEGAVRLVDPATGRTLRALDGSLGPGAVLAAGPSGALAGGGRGGAVRVWDAATGALVHDLRGDGASVVGLAFTVLDGRPALASCALDGSVTVRDLGGGERAAAWRVGGAWPTGLAAALVGGRAALVTSGEALRVWRPDGTPVRELAVPCTSVTAGGGRLAAGSPDGAVRVWDLETGTLLAEASSDDGAVTALAFDGVGRAGAGVEPDGTASAGPAEGGGGPGGPRLVCGTAGGAVRVHDGALRAAAVLTPHAGQVLALAFCGGMLASGGVDGSVRLWDPGTGVPLRRLSGRDGGVAALAAGRVEGREVLVSAGYGREVRVWDPLTGELLLALPDAHPGPVYALAVGSSGGRPLIASGGLDGAVLLWDARSGEAAGVLECGPAMVVSLRFAGDVLLAGRHDGVVRRWRLPGGEPLTASRVGWTPLALSPDGYAAGLQGLATLPG
uniref:WD40 repeat domain-containing protein n=1 Tax=Nonomuraea pusilla TaxID=46177 RepID=UPI0006E36C48|nr:WD40 repeat domain-containing protein [Nonomuraea pusilla]